MNISIKAKMGFLYVCHPGSRIAMGLCKPNSASNHHPQFHHQIILRNRQISISNPE